MEEVHDSSPTENVMKGYNMSGVSELDPIGDCSDVKPLTNVEKSDVVSNVDSYSHNEATGGSEEISTTHKEEEPVSNTSTGSYPRLSESSSDGMLSKSPSVEQRSRLTSAEDTDGTIKSSKQIESDSSDSKSIETLDYTSSEDKSIETIDSEEDQKEVTASNIDVPNRPESLLIKRPVHYEKRRSRSDELRKIDTRTMSNSIAVEIPVKRDAEFENIEETMLSKSMPHGTVMKKGDMIEFVADDLQEMIKRSSPLTQTESSATSSRRSSLRSYSSVSSSTSSAIGGMSRSPSSLLQQSPDDIPPIDPQAVHDLEMHALKVADNLDLLMGNLKTNLHKMSAITVGCLSAYKTSVDTTCDSVDSSIKSMYALMAKCEELSNSMKPVYKLSEQIKEIKRLLDRFESQIADKT